MTFPVPKSFQRCLIARTNSSPRLNGLLETTTNPRKISRAVGKPKESKNSITFSANTQHSISFSLEITTFSQNTLANEHSLCARHCLIEVRYLYSCIFLFPSKCFKSHIVHSNVLMEQKLTSSFPGSGGRGLVRNRQLSRLHKPTHLPRDQR
jgi:hypothetical protein